MIMQKIVMFIDDFKTKYIREIANIMFLITSCALTVHGIVQISDQPVIQWWIGAFAITVDIYMQYVLAWGRWLWKTNWFKAAGLFVVYLGYMIIYNFLFAIGFFMTELDIKEQVKFQKNVIISTTNQRIQEINDSITILNKHLETESQSGYGSRSQKITEDKNKLIEERNKLLESLSNSSDNKIEVFKNVFNSLENVFKPVWGWSANWLKILVFGSLVLTMQICLILTSWNINPAAKSIVNTDALSDDKKELLKWLDAAFEGRSNGALNGVHTISEVTGLTLERCIQIRDYLSKLKVNGGMAIAVAQGASKNNYDKNFIRDYILSH